MIGNNAKIMFSKKDSEQTKVSHVVFSAFSKGKDAIVRTLSVRLSLNYSLSLSFFDAVFCLKRVF